MLTHVILGGELGEKFGEEWDFKVDSVQEALRMVEANKPGFFTWVKKNLPVYSTYGVIVEYKNGNKEQISKDTITLNREMKSIELVPLPYGAGHTNWTQVIEGVALIVAAYFTYGASLSYSGATAAAISGAASAMAGIGVTMMLQGFITGLSSQASVKDTNSFTLNGPTNTTQQGNPVPLIYGRVLVGSQAVSASLNVNKLM